MSEAHDVSDGYIGRAMKRFEDPRFIQGQGRYIDDLKPPGLLHAALIRSPYGHARISGIDTAAARERPGVVGVYTAADLPDLKPLPARASVENSQTALAPVVARDRVRFVGELVAAVVAESRYQAEDAARAIEIEYEPLPAVTRAEAAAEPDAPRLHDDLPDNICYRRVWTGGDVDGAFQRAVRTVSVKARHHRIAPVPLEPRAALAEPTGDDGLTLWLSSQSPHRAREGIAASLGISPERMRVVSPDVGGGFGAKGSAYREDVLICALALELGRPVKWTATRMEDLLTTQHARDQVDEITAAFDSEGRVLALRTRTIAGIGAYAYVNTGQPGRVRDYATGAYRIPAHEAEIACVYTNTAPTGAYRGAGRPEASYLIERLMDRAVRELQIDPVELRRRNFLQPSDFPYRTPNGAPYDSGNYPALLDKALELADYTSLRNEQRERQARGELVGIGLATFIETTANGWEGGAVEIEPDGRIIGTTGSHSHGQGHETTFAQILADQFGVSPDLVTIRHGDTALIARAIGTFGSRSATLGGGAMVKAADEVKEQIRTIAADQLEASPDDLEIVNGSVRVRGAPERSRSLGQIAVAARSRGAALQATTVFEPPQDAISAGAYVGLVSVDAETGRVRLERMVAVDDCGVVLNPTIVAGQVHGALAQGIGETLVERMVYDDDGQVLSASLLDYALPTALLMPELVLGHTVTPNPNNPLGAKGAGEAGTIGAPPTIVNAVLDALAPLGVTDLDLPLHEEKVWRAIQQARSRGTNG